MSTDPTPIPRSGVLLGQEYDQLRKTGDVHRVLLPDSSLAWLVTDPDTVSRALADPRLALNRCHSRGAWSGFALPPALDANLLNMDSPDHTRLRRLVSPAFSPQRVAALRPGIRRIADQLLDMLVAAGGTADLVTGYCTPLSVQIIAELLGVPEAGRTDLRAWTDTMLTSYPPDRNAVRRAVTELHGYVVNLIDEKRRHPGDDLLSTLVTIEEDADRLSRDELTSLAFLIVFAGYENTANLIASTVLWLLDHDGLDAVPVPEAIEEALRHAPPAPVAIRRFPVADLMIGGVTIPAGDTVLLGLAAATRGTDGNAARLAFGNGPHYCMGAALARIEAEEALTALAHRLPGLTLAVPGTQVHWRPTFRTHGPAELLVRW
ncbi:cytochrome P450 [Micromonospora sp. WMMA1363]|uniref:cytochrome P450 family protein n=1 Tax=Micromonospora sp. WMMA1363 TaxID=3053985 RepID=UPI00259C9241|nr:cytochrome P450 [Micromonospora sp. WMMA1363]MDM4721488.1 cytochrome P450 [Micromonospora sp. WMMA1363]